MEAVAAGAFPVVREWPAYARYRGAAGIFPAECVVTTVEEAVEIGEETARAVSRGKVKSIIFASPSRPVAAIAGNPRLLDG